MDLTCESFGPLMPGMVNASHQLNVLIKSNRPFSETRRDTVVLNVEEGS